jgi:peptidoglycan hydrolase CwlO-like protein
MAIATDVEDIDDDINKTTEQIKDLKPESNPIDGKIKKSRGDKKVN